jgi:hypothetical protein
VILGTNSSSQNNKGGRKGLALDHQPNSNEDYSGSSYDNNIYNNKMGNISDEIDD